VCAWYFDTGDRSNAGVDIIDTKSNTFKRTIPGFVGIKLLGTGAVDNNHSGPDGVASHGRWLYAGDGDSTLKVIDLNAPTASAIKQSISTGGTTRVDEMALTTDGKLLLALPTTQRIHRLELCSRRMVTPPRVRLA
jgi:hypothetical protein